MILLYGKNNIGNVIHAVIGPESELWSNLHGSLTVDITGLLGFCDKSQPVMLNISNCASESWLVQAIQEASAQGGNYPFLPNTAVFSPSHQPGNEASEAAQDKSTKTKKSNKTIDIIKGKCSRCPDEHAELIPDLTPPICFNCARIDLYMSRKERPFGNPNKFEDM